MLTNYNFWKKSTVVLAWNITREQNVIKKMFFYQNKIAFFLLQHSILGVH